MNNENDEKNPKQKKKLHKGVSVAIVVVIILAIIAAVIVAIISVDKINAARDYAEQTQLAQSIQTATQTSSASQ